MRTSALAMLLFALTATAAKAAGDAEAPGLTAAVRNALAVLDRDNVVLAFELTARNGTARPVTLRSVDYSVSAGGLRLFSGTAQGFELPAGQERAVTLGGSGGDGLALLARIAGLPRFSYRVTGTLHGFLASGEPVDQPFAAVGWCTVPEPEPAHAEPAQAQRRPGSHSLLDY